jgi:hypothetical protein
MFRFTIRELVLLTLVAAMGTGSLSCDRDTPYSTSFEPDDGGKQELTEPEAAQHGLPIGTWKIDAFSVANTRDVVPVNGSGQVKISSTRMTIVGDSHNYPMNDGYTLSEADSQDLPKERGIIRFKAIPDDPLRVIPGSDWKQSFCGIAVVSGKHLTIAFGDNWPNGFEPSRVTDFAMETEMTFFIRAHRVDSKKSSVP